MKLRVALLSAVAAITVAAPDSAPAVQRTFVASTGNDGNPCSLTLPCRGFAAAVAAVDAGGEVIVLDSAGYGPFAVAKSVSIIAPTGVYAGITVFAGDGVVVTTGANDKVVLRGLTVNGRGGVRGIVIIPMGGGEVHVENCVVANMSQSGIEAWGPRVHIRGSVARSNAGAGLTAGGGSIYVSDSQLSGNSTGISLLAGTLMATRISVENNDNDGIFVHLFVPPPGAPTSPSASTITAAAIVSDSVVSGNGGIGVHADNGLADSLVRMEIVRSTIARNAGAGLVAEGSPNTVFAVLTDSTVVDNGQGGVFVYPWATTAVVTGSTIAGNGDLYADLNQYSGSVLRTSGTNTLTGRGAADVNGTLTPNPMK